MPHKANFFEHQEFTSQGFGTFLAFEVPRAYQRLVEYGLELREKTLRTC